MDLNALQAELPLPPGWGTSEVVRHVTRIGAVAIDLAGLTATNAAGAAVTAGAGCVGGDPLPRAYYELVERTGILEALREPEARFAVRDLAGAERRRAPASTGANGMLGAETFRPSRSNGVALGPTWTFACERAAWELAERDQVLRAWYGGSKPTPVASEALMPAPLSEAYEVTAHRFGPATAAVSVVAVVCWPRDAARPLVLGYGARPVLDDALRAARDECLQRLGFLWDEALPTVEPPFAPTPDFHQDYTLWPGSHASVRRWLAGGHLGACHDVEATSPRAASEVEFLDLTPPALRGRAAIAQAIPRQELALGFGRGHPSLRSIPTGLEIHPVA